MKLDPVQPVILCALMVAISRMLVSSVSLNVRLIFDVFCFHLQYVSYVSKYLVITHWQVPKCRHYLMISCACIQCQMIQVFALASCKLELFEPCLQQEPEKAPRICSMNGTRDMCLLSIFSPVGFATIVICYFAREQAIVTRCQKLTCAGADVHFSRHNTLLGGQNTGITAANVLHGDILTQSICTLYFIP